MPLLRTYALLQVTHLPVVSYETQLSATHAPVFWKLTNEVTHLPVQLNMTVELQL